MEFIVAAGLGAFVAAGFLLIGKVFRGKTDPIESEAAEAVRLYGRRGNSPADMVRWIDFRNAGLRKRGHIPLISLTGVEMTTDKNKKWFSADDWTDIIAWLPVAMLVWGAIFAIAASFYWGQP